MSEPSLRVGHVSDTHLDYYAYKKTDSETGINVRLLDGLRAFEETVTQLIEAQVDLVLHTGDLFHISKPTPTSIEWANKQLRRLARANIPVVGNTGNHDASANRALRPATASINDWGRKVMFVTEPYRLLRPVDGLSIHMITHYGLAAANRLVPEPVEGDVNVLSAHGSAMVPGHEVFHCVDSPGEQPIGLDLLIDPRYVGKWLGHYHGMDEIIDNVWYAGSSIRRGWSDPPGGRGWLLHNIDSDGTVTTERKFIHQRPQYDLPVIDAAGMNGADVEEQIRTHLTEVDVPGAMIRQVVNNCSTFTRKGIDQSALEKFVYGDGKETEGALWWQPELRRPAMSMSSGETVEGSSTSMTTAGASDLPSVYGEYADEWANGVGLSDKLRPVVVREGTRLLKQASGDVATDFSTPQDSTRTRASKDARATTANTETMTDADTGQQVPWS